MAKINGNSKDNTLSGTPGSDTIRGKGGNDTLSGFAGADILDGGTDSDLLKGGSGNDSYVVDDVGDVIDEEGNDDAGDLVRSSVTVNLATLADGAIENALLVGSSNINASGGDSANNLTGNSGKNVLSGGLGNDALTGGDRRDTLTGGGGTDRFVYLARAESPDDVSKRDTIIDFTALSDAGAEKDKIDLSALSGPDLAWGGTSAVAKGVWYTQSGGNTIVNIDLKASPGPEMQIVLQGLHTLLAQDFIGVASDNAAPTTNDVLINTNQNTAIIGNLGAADPDSGDTLVFSIETGPQHGTLDLDPDGSYTYTPTTGYAGGDSFTFKVTDFGGLAVTGEAGVTVAPVTTLVRYLGAVGADETVNATSGDWMDVSEVTALTGGGHLVVWSTPDLDPAFPGWGVFAQRYDDSGQKVGSEFRVNTSTGQEQELRPSVAGLSDGGFVVAWETLVQSPDSSGFGIFAQRFDASGNPVGGEFLVNQATFHDQFGSTVSALDDGNFVVTWTTFAPDDASWDAYARLFAPDVGGAIPVTDEFVVNTATTGDQSTFGSIAETVTDLDDGRFVVVWNASDGTSFGVFARVFEADGTAVNASEVPVNTTTEGIQHYGSVGALGDGGFVVTWVADDDSGNGIFAQRFDADGNAVGDELSVNTWTIQDQSAPKISALSDGGFVISWMSFGVHGNLTYAIGGQHYDSTGNAVGGEFIINTSDDGNDQYPSLALRDDGALIATWTNGLTIEQKVIEDFSTDVRPLPNLVLDDPVSGNTGVEDVITTSEVTALADGGHLVVWSRYSQPFSQSPDAGWGVFAQRYDDSGQKVGNEFLVNTPTDSDQRDPSAAGLSDGSFVVTWSSYSLSPTQDRAVLAQRFDASGNKVGGEFLVNQGILSDAPTVSALNNGNFVVTWTEYNSDSGTLDIFARVFAPAAGGVTALTDALVVNTSGEDQWTLGDIAETVTSLEGSRFAVVWTGLDSSGNGVFVRVFEADGTPVNANEVPANTTTAGAQTYAAVGALQDGGFVVTWVSYDGSSNDIFAQRFDADGNAVGDEFAANMSTILDQSAPKISGLSDGGFVIAWKSLGAQGNEAYAIVGQRYDAAGNKVGSEFVINTSEFANDQNPSLALREDGALIATWTNYNTQKIEQKVIDDFSTDVTPIPADDRVSTTTIPDSQMLPEVTRLANGGHLVVWSAFRGPSPDPINPGVYGQLYDASGEKVGSEFLVNAAGYGACAIGLSDGGFAVTWEGPDGSGVGIVAQRYDADGATVGSEFLINTTTFEGQRAPSMTELASGGFVVTWYASGTDDNFARVFAADGTPLTAEFQVNQTISARPAWVYDLVSKTEEVVGLSDGRFVMTWTNADGSDGSGGGIYARVFEADGTAVTDEFQVNTTTLDNQVMSSVGSLSGGGFVVTWTDWGNDGSNRGVFAQLYDANGLPLGNEFQVNTWETNDQAASKVQGLPDGGFVIVWHSYGVGGIPNHDISGQRYDAAGNKVDGEFIVNNPTGSDQTYPSIDIRDDGALIVVWQADGSRIEQKIITSLDSTATTKDLTGRPGNDSFLGSQLIDNLDGVGGDDRLAGLGGDDTIEGGPGSDTVVFNTASDGIDTIIGFVSGVDRLEISAVNFGHGLAAGGAAILVTAADIVSAFYAGANGYFIFDNDGADAGKVYWDENGDSGADAVAIAELLGVTSLLSSDIILA